MKHWGYEKFDVGHTGILRELKGLRLSFLNG